MLDDLIRVPGLNRNLEFKLRSRASVPRFRVPAEDGVGLDFWTFSVDSGSAQLPTGPSRHLGAPLPPSSPHRLASHLYSPEVCIPGGWHASSVPDRLRESPCGLDGVPESFRVVVGTLDATPRSYETVAEPALLAVRSPKYNPKA
ncbi:hypothetical protein CMUS01_03510 [Colletotrichum musicola]|uniref:Uncharacterized protein n=1 Tax=Colletotrichum musicola TaxID=2175873 RepID=A0A8H6U611_9PEZI|nr:hypothetical protein CMUS01_03510 [Colletotrichum musicola]